MTDGMTKLALKDMLARFFGPKVGRYTDVMWMGLADEYHKALNQYTLADIEWACRFHLRKFGPEKLPTIAQLGAKADQTREDRKKQEGAERRLSEPEAMQVQVHARGVPPLVQAARAAWNDRDYASYAELMHEAVKRYCRGDADLHERIDRHVERARQFDERRAKEGALWRGSAVAVAASSSR